MLRTLCLLVMCTSLATAADGWSPLTAGALGSTPDEKLSAALALPMGPC